MTEIIRKITVDLARRSPIRLIFAGQYDQNSRRLLILLTEYGKPYRVEHGVQAVVGVKRADETAAAFAANITEDGAVSFLMPHWMLAVTGEARCTVSLIDGESKRLTSCEFTVDVAEAIYSDEVLDSEESYDLLTSLLARASAFESAEQGRAAAEEARAVAETDRIAAETDRAAAEEARIAQAAALESRLAANEAGAAAMELRLGDLEETVESGSASRALSGKVTLYSYIWNSANTMTFTLDSLGEHDLVQFTPATKADSDKIDQYGIYVSVSEDYHNSLIFQAAEKPAENINLHYFMLKGQSV